MLADDVILFRNLTRHYLEEFSSQFLRLLYAYVYIHGQNPPPISIKELQIFLEPANFNSPPPALNSIIPLDDFKAYGGVIKDVIWAFYLSPWTCTNHISLIKNIFITHFDQATAVIQEVLSSLIQETSVPSQNIRIGWALTDLLDHVLPIVPHPSQVILSNMGLNIIEHLRQTPSTLRYSLPGLLNSSSRAFQLAGLPNGALEAVDEAIELRRSSFDSDSVDDIDELCWSYLHRAFILCDMARVSEAMEAAQEANTLLMLASKETKIDRKYLCIFRTRILQRTARSREAIQVLETFMFRKDLIMDSTFDMRSHFLRTELAAIRGEAGYLGKAIHDTELVVMACRKEVRNIDVENQKGALVHSLTTLSNCLDAVGRNKEALVVAEEATSIYNSNAPRMWGDFLYTIRKQEFGGNAFHSLSLRLTTSGQLAEALTNAKKATKLYRELVSLAPRHFPTLVKSLRNIAAILWKIGHPSASIAACEEAINILRKVSDSETYFLGALREALDQLAGYFFEEGKVDRASAVTTESAEVRRRIKCLLPQPEFLFWEIKTEPLEDDEDEAWETATGSDDEYHDALDADFATKLGGEVQVVTYEHGQLQPACVDLLLIASVGPQLEEIAVATSTMDEIELRASPPGEHKTASAARISMLGKSRLPEVLATELKLSSTPISGILWWIWLGILSTAVAVLWSRA
ncbi:hypothetical protein B0H11DRAFT_2418188 [Mycena galericulata]|nr:hypothetical protein B0H11DRAFT_2418188 [Mycena galericulata]